MAWDLSGGQLRIRYASRNAIEKAVIKLEKNNLVQSAVGGTSSMVFTQFDATGGGEGALEIPLPATPGLRGIREVVILLGDHEKRASIDLLISEVKFTPMEDGRPGA